MLFTTSIFLDFILVMVAGIFAFHLYLSKKMRYWENRGVYSPKTKPFVGHFLDVLLLKMTIAEWYKKYYDQVDKDFFGLYVFDDHYFVPKDPNLIKNILIKDFNYFVDRNIAAPVHSPAMAHILFVQKSPQWRHGRNKLTSSFSSAKLKAMYPLFISAGDDLKEFLDKNQTVMEAKELSARFTTDLISKCAFGINAYSYEETDSLFTAHRRKIFKFSLRNIFNQAIYFFKPSWVNKLKLEFMEKDTLEFFTEAFMNTMKARKSQDTKTNIKTNDLIDIIIELKYINEVKSDGSDDMLFCGAALTFFIAGFETTSATISFTLYQFAIKPHIQEEVRKEIKSVISKYGSITYEAIQDMPYLDMCINETLRLYPALPFIDRKCTKDYPIPNTDITIEKNTYVLIPMYGLHLDEKYFPDPLKYDPERFRNGTENSNGIYLPFGDGPRHCIGKRFGKISAKIALINIVGNFEVCKCPKTPDPVIFETKTFLLQSTVGLPLKFIKLQ